MNEARLQNINTTLILFGCVFIRPPSLDSLGLLTASSLTTIPQILSLYAHTPIIHVVKAIPVNGPDYFISSHHKFAACVPDASVKKSLETYGGSQLNFL